MNAVERITETLEDVFVLVVEGGVKRDMEGVPKALTQGSKHRT